MNAIIYIRVSTTEQAETGFSLKAQEEVCREYAKRNKFEILKIFIEKGESAKTINRTELKKLLEYINLKSKDIDYLIVFKLDRLTRNLFDYANLISLLTKYGITLKSATESISPTPEGTLMQNIIASFAQYDNDQRSQRTRSGMIQTVKEGHYVWKAPMGYRNNKKEGEPSLIPIEEKIIIDKIFTDFVKGKKQYNIINDLKDFGINLPKQTFKKILLNPVYIGKMKTSFFDYPVNGDWDPIIDEIIFYKAHDILAKKTLSNTIIQKTDDFPLRRFLICPICHSKLTGSWSKGRTRKSHIITVLLKDAHLSPLERKRQKLYLLAI